MFFSPSGLSGYSCPKTLLFRTYTACWAKSKYSLMFIKNYYYWFNLLICSKFTFSRDCRLHLSLFALLLFVQAPSISSSVHLRFRSWISLIILNTSALEMRLSVSSLPAKSEENWIHQKYQALSLQVFGARQYTKISQKILTEIWH